MECVCMCVISVISESSPQMNKSRYGWHPYGKDLRDVPPTVSFSRPLAYWIQEKGKFICLVLSISCTQFVASWELGPWLWWAHSHGASPEEPLRKLFPLTFDPRAHGAWALEKQGVCVCKTHTERTFFLFSVALHFEQDSLSCDKWMCWRAMHAFCSCLSLRCKDVLPPLALRGISSLRWPLRHESSSIFKVGHFFLPASLEIPGPPFAIRLCYVASWPHSLSKEGLHGLLVQEFSAGSSGLFHEPLSSSPFYSPIQYPLHHSPPTQDKLLFVHWRVEKAGLGQGWLERETPVETEKGRQTQAMGR